MPWLTKSNTWTASYQDENGRQRTKTFKTKEQAINWEREKKVYQRRRREKKERELTNLSERKESVKNSNAVEAKGITLFQELAQEAASQSPFLQKLTSDKLFKKNVEGTLADVYIHEDTKEDDRKVRCLQFKATEKKNTSMDIYKFNHVNRGKYKNCLIICVALDSQKIWWIEYDSKHLPDKHGTLDMGRKRVQAIEKDGGLLDFKDQISIKRFEDAYNNLPMISEIEAREPTSPTQKKEHLGFQQYIDLYPRPIRWKVPQIENGVVDMYISFDTTDDFKKVQFKSLSINRTKNKNGKISSKLQCRHFSKCLAGTRSKGKQCYNFGDNDLYVFLCFRWEGEDKRKKDGNTLKMTELCGYFEIPEEALLARDLVVEKGKVGRECFYLYPPAEHRALYGINANPVRYKKYRDKEDPTKHWTERFYHHLTQKKAWSK